MKPALSTPPDVGDLWQTRPAPWLHSRREVAWLLAAVLLTAAGFTASSLFPWLHRNGVSRFIIWFAFIAVALASTVRGSRASGKRSFQVRGAAFILLPEPEPVLMLAGYALFGMWLPMGWWDWVVLPVAGVSFAFDSIVVALRGRPWLAITPSGVIFAKPFNTYWVSWQAIDPAGVASLPRTARFTVTISQPQLVQTGPLIGRHPFRITSIGAPARWSPSTLSANTIGFYLTHPQLRDLIGTPDELQQLQPRLNQWVTAALAPVA
jgi:hypothetical protein